MLELLTDIESVSNLVKIDVRRDDAEVKAFVRPASARHRIPGALRRIADGP